MDNELLEQIQEDGAGGVQNIDNINYNENDDINQKEIQLGAPVDGTRKKKKKKKKKRPEDESQIFDQQQEEVIQEQQPEEQQGEQHFELVENALDSFRASRTKKSQVIQLQQENLDQNQDAIDQILQDQQPQFVQLEDGNYQQAYYDQNAQPSEMLQEGESALDHSPVKKKKKKKKKKPVDYQDGMNSELMNPEYNQESYMQQAGAESNIGIDYGQHLEQSEQKVDIDNLINQLQEDQQHQDLQNGGVMTTENYNQTQQNNTLMDTENNELVPPVKTKKKKKKKRSGAEPIEEGNHEPEGKVVLLVDSLHNIDESGYPRSDSNLSPEKQRIIRTAEKHNVNRDQIIFEEEQKEGIEDFNQSMYKANNQSLIYSSAQMNESINQDDQRFFKNDNNDDYNQINNQSQVNHQPILLQQDEDQQEQFQADQNNQLNAPYGNNVQSAQEYQQSACRRMCSKFWNAIQYEKSTQPFEERSTLAKMFSSNPSLLRPKAKPLNIQFGNQSKVNSQCRNNIAPANHKFVFGLYILWQILLKKINVYFFFLGVVASLIYWENSRNFGCMIAVYLFSVFCQFLIDFNLKKRVLYAGQFIDNLNVLKSSNQVFNNVRRGDLRQGDVVKIKEGELLPADILIVLSSNEELFINLDNHGSQSGFDRKYIPQEIRQLDKTSLLSNAFNLEGTITSQYDTLYTTHGKWEGLVRSSGINSGNEFKISEENIGIKNSKLINTEFIIGIVVFHSERSKYNGVNFKKEVFYHPLNSFINLHVFVSFFFIILFSIILCVLGSSFASDALNNHPYLKKVDDGFKVFMNYVVILTSLLPIFLYPILGVIDLTQAFLINRMPDDWDEIIYCQKQQTAISAGLLDQEMKPLDISKQSTNYDPKPVRKFIKSDKEFAESTKKLHYDDEKKNKVDLKQSTATEEPKQDEKGKKKEISKFKEIIFDGQKISFLGNLNVIVSDLENINERYTEFQGFTAYDIGFDQNNNSHLFDGMNEREMQQVVKLFKFGLMSIGRNQQTKEDLALKEYCEKLEIFYSSGEEDSQFIINTMNVEEKFNINFATSVNSQRPFQTTYISRQNNDIQLLMRGVPEAVMDKMLIDIELTESIKTTIKQFRARGYTCQILATKIVDDKFSSILNSVKEMTVEADQHLFHIENELEYLGLFAFKTSYRDPFNRLAQSYIKPWYVTEQAYQYQPNIFKENSLAPTFRILKADRDQLIKDIDYQFKLYRLKQLETDIMKQISNYKIKYNMETDGKVLYELFNSKEHILQLYKIKFFNLMLHSQSCIIWNCDPLLKSSLISQVKGCVSPSLNFLAIGFSEKDIPLMLSSDVSLVYSREDSTDQQCILPYADGKVTSFKQLNYLILSYGRQHYHKSQQLCKYMIEKNIIFTTLEFIYAFYVMYSGQLFFCNIIYFFYEFLFATWGAAFFYLFDFDIQMYQQIEYPQVYLQGSLEKLTTISQYFIKALTSFLQGIFIFFITAFTLQEAVDGTGVVMNHGFTQICAVFTIFNLMKYKQIVHSTNISYHYWILILDYILFIVLMYILQTKGISFVSYINLDKMVGAFFSSTSSFFIFLTIGFICIIPEIASLVNQRLLKRNPIYQIIGFNYGLYEKRQNPNVPILTQNYYPSQLENFAKIAPENKAKMGVKKEIA